MPGERDATDRVTLVLDFDGTVCLGDGLVWAYADGVLPHLSPEVARGVSDALTAYLGGHPLAEGYADGYTAIAALAGPHVEPPVLSAAYADSRRALADAGLDVHAPDGLADLLESLANRVRSVVVTNAPSTGLDAAMDRLGLAGVIDDVICSAGKPEHAAEVLQRLLDGAPAPTLMSVGDIWVNDIAPALELGCATGFIDRSGRDRRAAHARGRAIQQLYPAIETWARSPHEFVSARAPGRRTANSSSSTPDGSAP